MDHERTRRHPDHPRANALPRLVLLVALLAGPMLAGTPLGPAGAQEDTTAWQLDLASLNPPFSEASGFTSMAVSQDGAVVAVGLDNGGVVFLNATTGEELDAAQTADHGAVDAITLTANGSRAALVYDDGYIAVLDQGQTEPLLTLNTEPGGIPAEVRLRVAAQMTQDGRFLMVTDDQVYLFIEERDNGTVRYRQVGLSAENVGPFMYVHPRLPFFGALSAEGEVAIYSYGSSSLSLVGEQTLAMGADESIAAFASSGDGSRFAIALSSGQVRRYLPQIGPSGGQLVLDYEDQILGRPRGVVLSEDGIRLVAWSVREALWTEGRNRNVPDDEAAAADAATVRLKPPTFDQRFLSVDTSRDLLRVLARFVGSSAETRLYNMPEQAFFVVAEETTAAAGPSAVDAEGREVYRTSGRTLHAYRVTERELAPPALGSNDGPDETPGNGPADGGLFGAGVSLTVVLLAGGGLLVLILLAVLVPLLLAARRGEGPTLAPLAPEHNGPIGSIGSRSGGTATAPPSIRPVMPSAPPSAAPPEGLLVLQDVSVLGETPLHGLSAAWRRPAVVTIEGPAALLSALTAGLSGRAPVTGLLAVGGASAEETPMLFSRRIQPGLPTIASDASTPDAAYHAFAAEHRLPASLVARRIDADLGWLGGRRTQPIRALTPLDHWKLRLALAVIHRPHVVLLSVVDLPGAVARDPRVADAVGQVLRGVSRHFEVLVVLLDDGRRPDAPLMAWSDEHARLTPEGLSDRTMLQGGKTVRGTRNRRTSGRQAQRRDKSP